MPAVTSAAIRDPFISPAHLTKPERLASAGAAIYEGVAYCTISQLLTLEANGKTLKFTFFVIKVYDEN